MIPRLLSAGYRYISINPYRVLASSNQPRTKLILLTRRCVRITSVQAPSMDTSQVNNPLLAARRKYYQTLTISELVSECKARNVTVRRLRSQQDFIEAILKKDRELLSEERNSADKLDLRDNIKLLNGFLTDTKLSA